MDMKNFFSLKWFKDNKEEVKKPEVVDESLKKAIIDVATYEVGIDPYLEQPKPYSKLYYVNNVITVVLGEGRVLSKVNASKADYEAIKASKTELDIESIMISQEFVNEKLEEQRKIEEIKQIQEGFGLLEKSGEFEIKDNSVYFKGIGRSLPDLLVKKFIQLLTIYNNSDNTEFQSHKRFWFWCVLNPNTAVCDWLYDFLSKGDFKITKDGMFLAYRRICRVDNQFNSNYVDFISNSYVKIKTIWKKKPRDYFVHLDEDTKEYSLSKAEYSHLNDLGNLQDLYQNLDQNEENRYTDNHTNTMDIRIGTPVVMARSECNHSTANCGTGGLHFANKNFDYYSFGDTGLLMLVNPYNVVGIGPDKGRCCEYLPLCTLSLEEERSILKDDDFDCSQLEEYYAIEQLEDLEKRIKMDYVTELGKKEFSIPQINTEEIVKILTSLEDIRKEVSERVVQF